MEATPNGDVKVETAESFARDYLEDLFNNNKNLGAFEEETLDLNIKSKYDDIDVEEEGNAGNGATYTAASLHEEEEPEYAPLEPGNETFQVNGHTEVEVASQNGDIENEVLEPNHLAFTSQSEVLEPEVTSMRQEPVAQFEMKHTTAEEEEEADDIVAPIHNSRSIPSQNEEEESYDLKFKTIGLSKNWWESKHNESENQKEESPSVDKFRTIKQNIRKGNTRSLMARFEKLAE